MARFIVGRIPLVSLVIASSMFTGVGEGTARLDREPTLTSLGVTREDGSPFGVIGGFEQFRLQAPEGKSFREVVWKITGAIGKVEIRFNQNPLITPLPNPMVMLPPEGSTEVLVEFHWDGAGGSHSIDVSAVYSDGSTGIPERFSPSIKD